MQIERARRDDVPAIEALLTASALPLEGAADAFETGVVAHNGETVVGAAAVEPYENVGLLRSVVVAPQLRGTGIGAGLVDASESLARDLGISELYLLTETAEAWFSRRGYQRIERTEVPDTLRSSIEFTTACADTAVAMKRRLGS